MKNNPSRSAHPAIAADALRWSPDHDNTSAWSRLVPSEDSGWAASMLPDSVRIVEGVPPTLQGI